MTLFKRILCALTALAVLAAFSACKQAEKSSTQNESPKEDTVVNTYAKTRVKLDKNTKGIKILGVRNLESSAFINADWSCSGIEFYADCEGTLSLNVMSDKPCYYRAYVDEKPYMNGESPYFTVDGNSSIEIGSIERGTHLFRFVKATGFTLANTSIRSLTLCGLISQEAPRDNDLYLEFVGDSICCGWGVLPDENGAYNGSYKCQDSTLAYPYLIASELKADYSVTALSGQGLFVGDPGIIKGYKYASPLKNTEQEYSFERKPSAVIVNVGTNDYYQKTDKGITEDAYTQALVSFLSLIREKNTATCKIIVVYNVMNDTFSKGTQKAVSELGGESNGFYLFCAKRTSGERGNTHPSINENAVYAKAIGNYIKQILEIE